MTDIKDDLISRSALKKAVKEHFDNLGAYFPGAFITEINNAPTVEPFTQLEKEEIADAINYLLDAELLEENGYTEEVIKALKSALKKVGGAE